MAVPKSTVPVPGVEVGNSSMVPPPPPMVTWNELISSTMTSLLPAPPT